MTLSENKISIQSAAQKPPTTRPTACPFSPQNREFSELHASEFNRSPSSQVKATARPFPGPPQHWLSGNLFEFRRGMLTFFRRCQHEYGNVVQFRLGPHRCLLISDPEIIHSLLVTHNKAFRKHYATRLLKPVLGNGLLLSEGDFWLRQRRSIQPAFGRDFQPHFIEIVQRRTRELANTWTTEPQRDLYRDMTELTLKIAAEAFLGVECSDEIEQVSREMEHIHADFERRFQGFYALPTWLPTLANLRFQRTVKRLRGIVTKLIEKRRQSSSARPDMLSRLLKQSTDHPGKHNDQQLIDEAMTILLAGHDTTANALSWSWVLLTQHPDEIARIRSHSHALPSDELHAGKTPLDSPAAHVFLETMRLYPPAYLIGREALHDVAVKPELVIRRGTSVLLCQWLTHRQETQFPQPESFRPARWEKLNGGAQSSASYFPFGGGPRICIGKDLALLEGSQILNILITQFDIEITNLDQIKPWPTVTLRPNGPVNAVVKPITSGRQ